MRRRKKRTTLMLAEEFDKTEFVKKALVDKISLWMLRIIIKLGGHKKFLDKDNRFDNVSSENVMGFLA